MVFSGVENKDKKFWKFLGSPQLIQFLFFSHNHIFTYLKTVKFLNLINSLEKWIWNTTTRCGMKCLLIFHSTSTQLKKITLCKLSVFCQHGMDMLICICASWIIWGEGVPVPFHIVNSLSSPTIRNFHTASTGILIA